MNIDMTLEDLPGVKSSNTSYAKQQTVVEYDPGKVDPSQFHSAIESLGYKIVE